MDRYEIYFKLREICSGHLCTNCPISFINSKHKCGHGYGYSLDGNPIPFDMDHIDETKIVSMEGITESEYYHRYSDYTGYLWTEEEFKCGGHDLLKILERNMGKYIHIEIELYSRC